jgi:SsrA-binding protein
MMAKKNSDTQPGIKIIAKNKKAWFDYFVEEKYEAGIVLQGSEVKSLRAGHISMGDAFAKFSQTGNPELFLLNAHITEYAWANRNNHDPLRPRKLLLHKRELAKLSQVLDRQGLTLIPLSIYFKFGRVKVELGLCKGKKNYDKRETLKTKTAQREIERGD